MPLRILRKGPSRHRRARDLGGEGLPTKADRIQDLHEQLYHAQKMKSLGVLVAGLAHEVNNPVSLILMNLSLLRKIWRDLQPELDIHYADDPDRTFGGLAYSFLQENLGLLIGDMNMAAERIAAIVKALKDFSRRPSSLERRPVQVNDAVGNAARLMATSFRRAGADLDLELTDAPPSVWGNPQNIEQIVMNLAINAMEALPDGGGRVSIATAHETEAGEVQLTVTDNGRGINPDIEDQIFDPFVTDRQNEGGTGLGLSITYRLVNDHGGRISFRRQAEGGTVFTVRLPVIDRPKPAKVLVVDDEPPVRRLINSALSALPLISVEEAKNGTEALIRIGTFRPDLLILDVFMPEMDGIEVCRTIRSEPQLKEMRVLIITGHMDHPCLQQIREMGFREIYPKPISPQGLRERVKRLLRRSQNER